MSDRIGPFRHYLAITVPCASLLAVSTALNVIVGFSAQPASAAIRCEGNFQITEHGRIATLYCQDNYLARVAHEYGMRVSDEAVRYNVGVRKSVCLLVGYDIRVKDTCADYLPEGHRRLD